MKIELAIYTAQEGYSWQPGTSIDLETLKAYKARIGKFPSPDAPGFPFGGVFLAGNKVVFYRYHVAKKIDFRGRDALYCVLGVVAKDKAAEIDSKALFALPQFAAPMQPFPTEAELPTSPRSPVPDWLKNLDDHSLDVRILGTLDDLRCEVKQELTKKPESPKPIEVAPMPTVKPEPSPNDKTEEAPSAPKEDPEARKERDEKPIKSPLPCHNPPMPCYKNVFVVITGLVAVFLFTVVFALLLTISSCVRSRGVETGKSGRRDLGTKTAKVVRQGNVTSNVAAKGSMPHNATPKAKLDEANLRK